MENADPFEALKSQVSLQLKDLQKRAQEFEREVHAVDTSSDLSFKTSRKGLVKGIRAVEKDISSLKFALRRIEVDRLKYAHITSAELGKRSRVVDEFEHSVSDIKLRMESQIVREKMQSDSVRSNLHNSDNLNTSTHSSYSSSSNSREGSFEEKQKGQQNHSKQQTSSNYNSVSSNNNLNSNNDNSFIKTQKQLTKEAIRAQDKNLVELGHGVDRLHELSKVIHTATVEDARLLDLLDGDIQQSSAKMDTVLTKLQALLNTKDGCQLWTIVILSGILILLVALVIWS